MGGKNAGKVVLVTGSSSGIGLACARALAAGGATVAVHGRDPETVAAATELVGNGAQGWIEDLADAEAPSRLVRKVVDRFGRLDVLVNNAGIFPRTSIEECTSEVFDRIFAVNARAPLLLAGSVVAEFRKQGRGGVIVNIGSINAHCGQSNLVVYSMSKGALMTLTRNLADALAEEGIRVNQLNVGWTLTEMERRTQEAQGLPADWHRNLSRTFAPRGTILDPQEIARHVVFWASDASAPVSGQVYEVEQYPLIGRNRINEELS
jgi:NAD(P)-dependent dehydrogenase (short-subunit alcohol dehydrogenase family)